MVRRRYRQMWVTLLKRRALHRSARVRIQVSPYVAGTVAASLDGTVLIAGINAAGEIVGYRQTSSDAGGPLFEFVDITADLVSQGMASPSFDALNQLRSGVERVALWGGPASAGERVLRCSCLV